MTIRHSIVPDFYGKGRDGLQLNAPHTTKKNFGRESQWGTVPINQMMSQARGESMAATWGQAGAQRARTAVEARAPPAPPAPAVEKPATAPAATPGYLRPTQAASRPAQTRTPPPSAPNSRPSTAGTASSTSISSSGSSTRPIAERGFMAPTATSKVTAAEWNRQTAAPAPRVKQPVARPAPRQTMSAADKQWNKHMNAAHRTTGQNFLTGKAKK